MIAEQDIVGRGAVEGAADARLEFARLDAAAERKEAAAYVFVMGSPAEILRAFDMHLVFPRSTRCRPPCGTWRTNTSVRTTATRRTSAGYVKADVAMQLQGGKHAMGRRAKPALALATNACNTYVKWAEFWERYYKIPMVTLDIPGSTVRGGRRGAPTRSSATGATLRDPAPRIDHGGERITGKTLDMDRLREVLGYTNRMAAAWKRVLELNRGRPPSSTPWWTARSISACSTRSAALQEGAEYFERLVEEMEYKAAHRIGTIPDEKYRLLFVGCPATRSSAAFTRCSRTRAACSWRRAGSGSRAGWISGTSTTSTGRSRAWRRDPGRRPPRGDAMLFHDQTLIEQVDQFGADGIVYHPVKSRRTTPRAWRAAGRQS